LGLRYGRLDFLSSQDELTFLEVNPNGQFGWLDEPDSWPLHRAVLDAALDSSSAVRGDEAVQEGRIKPGSNVLLEAFGGGLSWASALIKW
jgi:hypothetical protein